MVVDAWGVATEVAAVGLFLVLDGFETLSLFFLYCKRVAYFFY